MQTPAQTSSGCGHLHDSCVMRAIRPKATSIPPLLRGKYLQTLTQALPVAPLGLLQMLQFTRCRYGIVAVTANWLIDCTVDGRMLDPAPYRPPEATEQLLDMYPFLRTQVGQHGMLTAACMAIGTYRLVPCPVPASPGSYLVVSCQSIIPCSLSSVNNPYADRRGRAEQRLRIARPKWSAPCQRQRFGQLRGAAQR